MVSGVLSAVSRLSVGKGIFLKKSIPYVSPVALFDGFCNLHL